MAAVITDELRPLDDLRPHPRNYNRHDRPGTLERMAAKIRHNAFTAPFIINRDGLILGGHLRRLALLALRAESYPEPQGVEKGWRVPCRVFVGNEVQELALLAGDNPDPAEIDFDNEGLAAILAELQDQGALEGSGYDGARLEALIEEIAAGAEPESGLLPGADPDGVPVEVETRCKSGDLWACGRHRVGAIDSRDPRQVKRLLAGAVPSFVFCDPPYGVEVVAANGYVGGGEAYDIPFGGVKNCRGSDGAAAPFGGKKKATVRGLSEHSDARIIDVGKYAPVIGDASTETAIEAYRMSAELAPKAVQVWWGGNYYADALPPSSCWIVWDKENTGNFADAELAWTNQPTAVRICRHMWNGLMKASERGQKRVHPTQKPVALAEWCFEKYGKSGDVILDLFLGSGMSLIAAEKMGDRSVVGAELSLEYCDVILARYELLTGQTAELLERVN